MVGTERLELSRVAPLEPKSSASTNFATSPFLCNYQIDYMVICYLMVRIIYIFYFLASIFLKKF